MSDGGGDGGSGGDKGSGGKGDSSGGGGNPSGAPTAPTGGIGATPGGADPSGVVSPSSAPADPTGGALPFADPNPVATLGQTGALPDWMANPTFTNTGSTDTTSAGATNVSPGTNVLAGGPGPQPAASPVPGAIDFTSLGAPYTGDATGGDASKSGGGIATGGDASKAGGASPGGGGGGDKSIMDSLGIKNPLGAAIGAAGLGYSVFNGQQPPKFSPQMEAQAASLNAQGQQLMSYLQSGNLPPGLKESLTQATSAAKAKIISNYASQGLNTDPAQNTALAQQLAAVDQQALISTAQIGQQLMTTGIQETGLSSDLYKTLANIDQTQTANIGKSIAAFAQAVSGTGSGINLKLS